MSQPIGGGSKKVLYTLNTVRRIGINKSAKALTSHNTCKACGLGMGGQHGGMTNELDEFPSVCNKSIQAQSTDIQAAIPAEVFEHSLTDFQQLSGHEMERLGRLNTPLFKARGSHKFEPMTWEDALDYAARQFAKTQPENSFFYSSGRASNEAGFVLQLLARLYGTNNVTNCSYYCHQATGVGLANTIGSGTATVELDDLSGADLVFVIGANPSSNHPRFIHKLKGVRDRGGEVIVINPAKEPGLVKFAVPKSAKSMLTGGTEIASLYLQPKIGSDAVLLSALGKALLETDAIDQDFIKQHSNGFDSFAGKLKQLDWDEIESITGLNKAEIETAASRYAQAKHAVFAWGMGITHHLHGVENVEAISNLALLRGMIGKRYAGLLPLRGHSNVQGIGTIGVKPVLADDVFNSMEQQLGVQLPKTPGLDTLASLQQARDGKINAALIMGGNLYEATPHSQWAQQALNQIDFKLFLTTTLNRGHVHGVEDGETMILPVTARDEEWQPTTQESMFNFVRLSDGGIARLGNVRPESAILCELAEQLLPDCGFDFAAFKSHQKVREAIAATVPGMENMADIGIAKREFHVSGRVLHTPSFNTPDGKVSFITHTTETPPSGTPDYPFMMSSIRSEGQFNSIIYEQKDSYRGASHRQVVFMNQADIQALGLTAGDRVKLRSEHGHLEDLQVIPFDIPQGNLFTYYPEANVLIGLANDPRSKTPAFKSQPVVVKKVI